MFTQFALCDTLSVRDSAFGFKSMAPRFNHLPRDTRLGEGQLKKPFKKHILCTGYGMCVLFPH